ncbi:MAG TPA: ATP-binding protein [Ardenticatenaceae bacterium]|nr:ATP-binding protein [Ardenticatenaceae bacterium]
MERLTLTHATVADLAQIADFVEKAAGVCGFDARTAYQIQMAVDEAASNVVVHGYGGQPGRIEIQVECIEGAIEILVLDWGRSFDLESVPEPDLEAPLDARPIGGLGLFFMRKFMDELEFKFDEVHGNVLRMRRALRAHGQT